jgi:hypothetical protein
VDNITAMQQNSTLIVDLATNDDGALTIRLPRNITDSKGPQDEDEDYIVLVDGIQTDTEEVISNNQTRTLSIDFENGAEQIEISGTRIIPEFRWCDIYAATVCQHNWNPCIHYQV